MTTPQTPPPPGWFPDPEGVPGHRWWDGTQWTAATQGSVPPWRSLRGLARATAAMMIVVTFVEAGIALAFQSRRDIIARLFANDVTLEEVSENDSLVAGMVGLGLLTILVAGIVWLVWFNAAHKNAATLRHVRYQSWSVGGWIVPVMNFFRPKQMVNDTWMAGDEGRDQTTKPAGISPLVQAWWVSWLVGGIVSTVGQQMSRRGPTGSDLKALNEGAQIVTIGSAISAVSAVLAAVMAIRITERLERRHSARVAPPSTGTTQPVT